MRKIWNFGNGFIKARQDCNSANLTELADYGEGRERAVNELADIFEKLVPDTNICHYEEMGFANCLICNKATKTA